MTGRLSAASIVLIGLLISSVELSAQIAGTIVGVVHDASGAVLPGVAVKVTGPTLQRESVSVVTGPDGTYRVPLVPAGEYTVTAELSNFQPQRRDAVRVAVNQEVVLDFTLTVAGVAEKVDVTSTVPLVETTRSDVTNRVTTETIEALPLNGRNFVDLIGLVPGARPDPGQGSSGNNVSIFGERGASVSFLVDGAENNDPLNGGPLLRYTQDSIREFEVMTTGYNAEFGRAQGGVANIITRSGRDRIDARVFWFGRNDRFDSSNIPTAAGEEQQDVPKLTRNQWGGSAGGPLKRQLAYFFGSLEVTDEQRGVNIDRSVIPAFILNGLATPGGVEDFGIAPKTDGFTGLFKTDVNFGKSNRLSASINRSTNDGSGEISSPVAGTTALPSAARSTTAHGTSFVARETAVLGSNLFLESSGSYLDGLSGSNLDQTQRSEPLLILLLSGFVQTGAPFGGRIERDSSRLQLAQTLSAYRNGPAGTHNVKLGWDYNRVGLTGSDDVQNDVEYSAAFLFPDAHAINADRFSRLGFQQSAARFFTLSANPDNSLDLDITSNDFSAFVQDSWQPRHDLTFNLGARYDYAGLFGDDHNNLAPRLGAAWDLGARHQTIVKANFGIFFDRNLLSAAATVPDKGGIFTRSSFDVALPRLGSDYTDSLIDLVITSGFPTANGRSPAENPAYRAMADALRADPFALYKLLGIAPGDPAKPTVINAGNVQQLSGKSPDQVLALLESTWPGTDWEFFDVPGGSILGERVLSFFPRGPLALSRDVSRYSEDRTPWTRAFSAGVDQQLGRDFSVAVTYVHRRTRDLLTRRIVNLFDASPGDARFGQTTDGGARISQVTYDGLINYDGVVMALRKRLSNHYQFQVSYTGSRARDNLLTGSVGSTFSNNNHPEIDFGDSNQSVPHIFVANGLVQLPFEFSVSGIVSWRSGSAFNPRGIRDLDGDGLVDQRDVSQPRNDFRVKSFGSIDMRVEKVFRLPGDHRVTALVEVFNLANRANVSNVNAVAGDAFGTPVAYFPGREIQLGVRYLFGR
jgi:outer membrane receptor protein involved in Fe transport